MPKALNLDDAVATIRQQAGVIIEDSLGVLKVLGADATSFLQAQTTNDVLQLATGQGQYSALLDRQGKTQAYFIVQKHADTIFEILAPIQQLETIQARLDQYLFTEDVTFETPNNFEMLWVQGPEARIKLSNVFNNTLLPSQELYSLEIILEKYGRVQITQWPISGEDGFLIICEADKRSLLLTELNLSEISAEALNTLRIEAGIPLFEIDFDQEVLLPATGLQQNSVSYTKGCFQGQEVVAKVKTYGSVGKSLTGVVFDESITTPFNFNSDIKLATGETIGQIKSTCYSPTLKRVIALAYLNRETRVPNKSIDVLINEKPTQITVKMLPFYSAQNSVEKAQTLYEAALDLFANNNAEQAECNLRQAIILNPLLADAYEVLGVILSRQPSDDKLEEAISLMQKLAELTPDEVMPHTNLSVFYAKKGLIEEAEVEKAKATTLAFKKAMAQRQQQVNEAELEAKRIADLQNKAQMFKAVLEDDPEDGLANFGLGQVLNQLRNYEASIPYLIKSNQVQPQHSLTYVNLGQAYEGTNQPEKALEVYEAGLVIATKKGDLMPLKQIQGRLEALK